MEAQRGRPKGRALDKLAKQIQASLAKTRRISVTAQELHVKDLTLRNYLRLHPELYPEDFRLQPRGILADIPHERITELLKEYTIPAAAEILGTNKGVLDGIIRRHPGLVPPEVRDPLYAKKLKKKARPKYVPTIGEGTVGLKNKPLSLFDRLLPPFKELNLLEKRLMQEWGMLPGEYFLLMFLKESPEPVESGVLADLFGVGRSWMSRYLGMLDKKKLVTFALGKVDRRTMVYAISPEGSALITKVAKSLADKPLQ